jgi:hypothetical protein
MKTAGFLFTIISLGTLSLGVSFAEQSSGQPPGQGLDENQTTSDRSADHRDGKQKGVNKEQADTMHPNLSDSSRASERSSQNGPIKKVILPVSRLGQDRPKQVANDHGVAGEKRVNNPQSKLPSVNDFHQPGFNQPSTAVAKDGSMMNRTGNNAQGWTALSSPPGTDTSSGELTRRLPVGNGTNASLPGVVHSRGASTPITGQLTPSRAKNSTGVLNGTGMKQRKP